jgi:hypothetical protein
MRTTSSPSDARYRASCALAPDQLGVRVVAERLLELLARDRELERRQVRAGEEADQVGRREAEAAVLGAHSSIVAREVGCSYGRVTAAA